jgi:hypothetical protein
MESFKELNGTIIDHFNQLKFIEKSFATNDILVELIYANFCQKLEKKFYDKLVSQESPNLIVNIFSPFVCKTKFDYHDCLERHLNEFLDNYLVETGSSYKFKIGLIIKHSTMHKYMKKILTQSSNIYFRPALIYIIYIWMTILNEEAFFKKSVDFKENDGKKTTMCNQIFKAYRIYESQLDNDVRF